MSQSSLAVVVYDPKSRLPPPAFMLLEMLHDIIVIEHSLPQATHPHEIRDMVADLRFMFATMHYCGDWSLRRRVFCLLHRARNMTFQLSHEFVFRCAALVDACRSHQPPSYDAMALAVSVCDDVLPYLRPLCKTFYIRDLRPCLVAFMEDSEATGSESDSNSSDHMDDNVPKHLFFV